jgi:phosphatidylglycerol:prolipoprotein diacylglycerol transferase
MYPLICKIGHFTVYSYGLILLIAFVVSSALARIKARKENLSPDAIFNLAFIVFILGILGARIFYISYNLAYYIKNPLEIIMLQYGGLSWFGGLIVGAISGIIYLKNKRLPIYKVLDLIAPFVALGQAIGRVGCLLNGCCYGKESELGIYFPVHDRVLIPTQIYSSLILVLIFIILRFLQERPHKEGRIFFIYLLLYSIKRFFIEFLRADNPIVFAGLTLFQIMSIIIFFIALLFLIRREDHLAAS